MSLIDDLTAERAALAEAHEAVSVERDALQDALAAWPEVSGIDPLDDVEARAGDLCAGLHLPPRDHALYLPVLPVFAQADVTGAMGEGEYEARLRFRRLTYWHDYIWMLEVDGGTRLAAIDRQIEAAS